MKAYIINLDSRNDRWRDLQPSLKRLNFLEFSRISAVSYSDFGFISSKFTTPGVTATWASHQKAYKLFLQTEDEYALIFEDDFQFRKSDVSRIQQISQFPGFDFLQLGFLKVSPLKSLKIFFDNSFDYFLRFLSIITAFRLFSHSFLSRKIMLIERRNLPHYLVVNRVMEGGHAYLISRRFAQAMLEANSPAFLSTDGFFMAISWMRTFRMARTRRSLFSQSNSPSSVPKRVLLEAD